MSLTIVFLLCMTLAIGLFFFESNFLPKLYPRWFNKRMAKISKGDEEYFLAKSRKFLEKKKRPFLGWAYVAGPLILVVLGFVMGSWELVLGTGFIFLIAYVVKSIFGKMRNKETGVQSELLDYNPGVLERGVVRKLLESGSSGSRDLLMEKARAEDDSTRRVVLEILSQSKKNWPLVILRSRTKAELEGQEPFVPVPKLDENRPAINKDQILEKVQNGKWPDFIEHIGYLFRFQEEVIRPVLDKNIKNTDRRIVEEVTELYKKMPWVYTLDRIEEYEKKNPESDVANRLRQWLLKGSDWLADALVDFFDKSESRLQQKFFAAFKPARKQKMALMVLADHLAQLQPEVALENLGLLKAHVPESVGMHIEKLLLGLDISLASWISLFEAASPGAKVGITELMDRMKPSDAKIAFKKVYKESPGLWKVAYENLAKWAPGPDQRELLEAGLQESNPELRRICLRAIMQYKDMLAVQQIWNARQKFIQQGIYVDNLAGKAVKENIDEFTEVANKLLDYHREGQEFEDFFCNACFTRAKKLESVGLAVPVCRRCGNIRSLQGGVHILVGVIGPRKSKEEWAGGRKELVIWEPENQTPVFADIDELVIRKGESWDYDWAVNAVLEALENGAGPEGLKFNLQMEEAPELSPNTQRMLGKFS